MTMVRAKSARVHAFGDDALGRHDAVGLAQAIARGEVSAEEARQAAIARAQRMQAINAIAFEAFGSPRSTSSHAPNAPFTGVPTFIKDNVAVASMPMRFGSAALPAIVPRKDEALSRMFMEQGMVVVGKSRLPELGFSPSTEYADEAPTRNPWNLEHSAGGSSGGAAALVASGVVPIAHGNDGGGSIRIPAGNTGLVGLKPTRGRLPFSELSKSMPVKLVSDGVLTRSVRDTAHFYAAAERAYPTKLNPIGLVEGPSARKLRIGLVFDSIGGVNSSPEVRAVVERTANTLAKLGHDVVPLDPPVPASLPDDFKLYWGFLAFGMCKAGKLILSKQMQPTQLDGLTRGLADYFASRAYALPLALSRLGASAYVYRRAFRAMDVVLSPVTTEAPPKLGWLNPSVPFDTLFDRIARYTAFTPLNNATGSPAIALPVGLSANGLPIGVHFSATHGDERTLIELAYTLEAELGFTGIESACPS